MDEGCWLVGRRELAAEILRREEAAGFNLREAFFQ